MGEKNCPKSPWILLYCVSWYSEWFYVSAVTIMLFSSVSQEISLYLRIHLWRSHFPHVLNLSLNTVYHLFPPPQSANIHVHISLFHFHWSLFKILNWEFYIIIIYEVAITQWHYVMSQKLYNHTLHSTWSVPRNITFPNNIMFSTDVSSTFKTIRLCLELSYDKHKLMIISNEIDETSLWWVL